METLIFRTVCTFFLFFCLFGVTTCRLVVRGVTSLIIAVTVFGPFNLPPVVSYRKGGTTPYKESSKTTFVHLLTL